jgi:hypothetical protein
VKEQHPGLRVISRTAAENVDAMLAAGAEGAVLQFRDEAAMRGFAGWRSRTRSDRKRDRRTTIGQTGTPESAV